MFTYWKRLLPTSLSRRLRRTVRWVTRADDPPHRLALGIALGLFCGLMPLVGLQTVLVLGLAWLLGANKAIGLPLTWLTNPATFVPIFIPVIDWARLLGTPPVDIAWWQRLADPPVGGAVVGFYWRSLQEVSAPLMLGSFLLASVAAVAGYYLSRQGIERLRRVAASRRRAGRSARPAAIG